MQEHGASTQSSPATSVSFSQFSTLGAIRGAKIVETISQLEQPTITRRPNPKTPAAGNFVLLSCAELSHELVSRHKPLLRSTTRTWIDHHACLSVQSGCESCDLAMSRRFSALPLAATVETRAGKRLRMPKTGHLDSYSPDHRLANPVTDDDFTATAGHRRLERGLTNSNPGS